MKRIMRQRNENDDHRTDDETRFKRIVNDMVKKISLKSSFNQTHDINANLSFKHDCTQKLEYDIAAVIISIDSPTFSKTTKNVRVTFQGKLASIGNDISIYFCDITFFPGILYTFIDMIINLFLFQNRW